GNHALVGETAGRRGTKIETPAADIPARGDPLRLRPGGIRIPAIRPGYAAHSGSTATGRDLLPGRVVDLSPYRRARATLVAGGAAGGLLDDDDADPGAGIWAGTARCRGQLRALRGSTCAGAPQLRLDEDVGSGGPGEHASGDRDIAIRPAGRPDS